MPDFYDRETTKAPRYADEYDGSMGGQKGGDVQAAVATLAAQIEEAKQSLAKLGEVLRPVLRPAQSVNDAPTPGGGRDVTCPLADELHALSRRADEVNDRLRDLHQRLSL